MKMLITGSNGLLGQKLARMLMSRPGWTVVLTGRREGPGLALPPHMIWHQVDITDREGILRLVRAEKPDTLIHCAAMTNVDECELHPESCRLMNVEGTRNMVEAANEMGAHLIHLSTDFIFDGTAGPYREEDEPNPISIYGQSKLEAERLIQTGCLSPWAIARTVLVYGIAPGLSRSNIILWVKSSLEQGKTIQVVDDQFRSPTLAEDLAEGCLLIAEKKATGIFNISGPDFITPYTMALQTAAYFGLDSSGIVRASAATFTQPARRPPVTGFVLDKARRELGYQPHTFAEGIAILARQMQEA